MDKTVVVFIFNSPLESGCDYVDQTMKVVAEKNPVYGVALGDIVNFFSLAITKKPWFLRKLNQQKILQPISFLPGIRFAAVRFIAYAIWCIFLRIFLDIRHLGSKKILWYFEPFHLPYLLWIFSGYTLVYDCVDYYPGFNSNARRQHDALMNKSDYIFANSKSLTKKLKKVRPDVQTVPLGLAKNIFDKLKLHPIRKRKTAFTVGFIGSMSDRIDFELMKTVVAKLPNIQFMFVGPLEPNVFGKKDVVQQQMSILLQYKNVRWLKGVAKKSIPAVLDAIDLGIIPYRAALSFNQFSFPMKTLEYFAAGKPVISTDIIELRDFQKGHLLFIAHSAKEFIKFVKSIQKNGWNKAKQRLQRARAFNHSWENKIQTIWKVIN